MATAGFGTPNYSNVYIESLVSEYFWRPGTGAITYYLKPGDINANGTNDWLEDNAANAFRAATAAWAAVANITFQEVFVEAGADWVEELLDLGEGLLGQHYFPNNSGLGGEFNANHSIFTAASNVAGGLSFTTFLHEIGHGLGLDHPHEPEPFPGVTLDDGFDTGNFGLNQGIWTTMTYNDGYDVLGASPSINSGWQTGPMALDIAAIQALYGANTSTNAGDTTHILPSNGYTAIWDASGTDWIVAAAGESRTLKIVLLSATLQEANGGGGYLSNATGVRAGFTIANGVVIENARGGAGADTLFGNSADNRLEGMDGNDILLGQDGDDTLIGGAGADSLIGYAGNDIIHGGAGLANTLQGGTGDDTYVVEMAGDSIVEFAGEGNDLIQTALPILWMAAEIERMVFTGAGAFGGIGNAIANDITGGTAGDTLIGGGGSDTLRGGTGAANTVLGGNGDDVFIVEAFGDSVIEYAGEGTDQVLTALSVHLLRENVENLTYTGTSAFIGYGNEGANTIFGGAGADGLVGYGGSDVLHGGAGAANTLIGGQGDDVYVLTSSGDSIVELAGEGADAVFTNQAVHLLAAHVENLIHNGVGNFTGYGNALDNILTSAGGDDRLTGAGGNDQLHGAGGTDTAVYADIRGNYTLMTGGSVSLTANGSSGEGTDTFTGIERLEFINGEVVVIASPIILDLGGDGATLVSASASAARFDLDGDGVVDNTSWIGSGEAFLFLDRNRDGAMSGIDEISFAGDLPGAWSDLGGLAAWDSNSDGQISAADARYADFGVWQDANSDGVFQSGEGRTLAEAGIASIALAGTAYAGAYALGETAIVNTGSFQWADGRTGGLYDAVLTGGSADTVLI